ncbi:MAG TPA: amidohydrolase family protein [Stellaceae bacterium]|nr:amidohydrolase family protein [Stellaceae bacterium]
MFYSCLPASSHSSSPLRARARGGSRSATVDIHCHVMTPEAAALTKDLDDPTRAAALAFASPLTREVNRKQDETVRIQLTSVEQRIKDMDRMGIDIQAVSPSPTYYYWTEPELGRECARLINNRIADVVASHPDRFVGLGTVPLQAPALAVAELERLVKELGLKGVEIGTNVGGVDLSDPRFRPFFAKAQELDILIFMHPAGFTHGQRLAEHYFINVIGNPLDTTVAISHMIFGGVLEAYPKLKICLAHGGGYAAAYSGRFDHVHRARPDGRQVIKRPPSYYLKKLYFDTIVFTHHQLDYLTGLYGSDHIILGTDYPYDMALPDAVNFVERAKLTRAAKDAILGGNAARLLKIKLPKKAAVKAPATKKKAKR